MLGVCCGYAWGTVRILLVIDSLLGGGRFSRSVGRTLRGYVVGMLGERHESGVKSV